MADYIRFTASPLHFMDRPQFLGTGFKPRLDFRPFEAFVTVHVLLESGFQYTEKLFTLFCIHVFCPFVSVGQALCRRRQRKYESPQSTLVAAAQPQASGPSPTAKWAMSAEARVMAKPA